jgi:hypothetical protein
MPKKIPMLPRQMSLFTEEELQEQCPLCGAAGDLVTCRRVYSSQRACVRCANGLEAYGWAIGK